MGSFEKLLVLTVIFLSAVVLAVSLTAPQKEGQLGGGTGSPSVVTPEGGAESLDDSLARVDHEGSRSVSPGNRIDAGTGGTQPASAPRQPEGGSVFLAPEGSANGSLDVAGGNAVRSRPNDLGALSAGAQPTDYPLTRGALYNARGDRRVLRDVPGLGPSPLEGQRTWQVGADDTWTSLAQLFYGGENSTEFLRAANDGWGERPDQARITVPVFAPVQALEERQERRSPRDVRGADPEPVRVSNSEPDSRTEVEATEDVGSNALPATYVVQAGDTLSGIAKELWGKSHWWSKLYEANRDVLANPDFVPEGTKLKVPRVD